MWNDLNQGFRANLPVAASAAAYGSVLGVLAAQKGLSVPDLGLMNTAVFAGSAQFVMVDLWGPVLPVLQMGLAVLVINLRYLLIGASLEPLFAGRGWWQRAAFMHLVADENWAVTMARLRRDPVTPWFLLGGGLCVYLAWSGGTLAGLVGGAAVEHPERYALDYAFTAVFTALAVGLWRGRRDGVPWLVAGAAALAAAHWLPGKWYILFGGLAGAAAAALGPESGEGTEGGGEGADVATS